MPILASLGAGSIGAYRLFRQVIAVTGGADGIDFDGTNDYLSRASDFTGNADGKTFTFSTWVWLNAAGATYTFYSLGGGGGGFIQTNTSSQFEIVFRNSSGTNILAATCSIPPIRTWCHILVSVDLTNASNASIYINDVAQSVSWSIYTNANIDFTQTSHNVGISSSSSNLVFGRLAHVYLDYTYRDLSVSANRRLFVTADLKPATGQETLGPIMYLKLNDSNNPGTNSGTGGNFNLTGTVARSGRGPNQYNLPYSDLSGSGTYMTKTSLAGSMTDSKTFTFACTFNVDNIANDNPRFIMRADPTSNNRKFQIYLSNGRLNVYGYNSAGSDVLGVYMQSAELVVERNYHFVFSVDLSDVSKRHFYLNGQTVNLIWSTYLDQNINFGTTPDFYIGRNGPTDQWYHDGRLGGVFFSKNYIDLSVAANLAKFVTGTGINAKPVDPGADGSTPLGVQPQIYLPMYGRNAGKNYGSGGDFTVTGGPYTGVRSANEYWSNRADFNGSTGYLSVNSLTGVSDGNSFSFSFFINPDGSNSSYLFNITQGGANRLVIRIWNNQNRFVLDGYNSSGTLILSSDLATEQITSGTNHHVCGCIDLSNTSKRFVYLNGVAMTGFSWPTYTNDNIDFTGDSYRIGNFSTTYFDGKLSDFYFTTSYIDFSLESNRLKFRDAFGNPVNLTQQIENGSIPNPPIYMRFDPSAFGTNAGTGGNFTVNGTVTDAGQI